MSPTAQTRLLRVIEQKELTRVGGTHAVPLDVRVVSATNRDLKSDASAGSFRPDLFYRLGVLPIRIPSLRERPEDIPILAVHFLALLARTPTGISPEAREKLCAYSWPGNIRELRNVMERAALAAEDGTIRARDVAFD
jgi:DNA-binding NtrC family response regulator